MNITTQGAIIAAMAAGLFTSVAPQAHASDSDPVHCAGVNSCKGKSACKSASNACAGKNSCKGKGWMSMTEKECKAKGGHVEAAPAPAPAK